MARLFLVPNTLDLGASPSPLEAVLPRQVMQKASELSHWVAEDAKSARALLKRIDALFPLMLPLQQISIRELPRPPKGGRHTTSSGSRRPATSINGSRRDTGGGIGNGSPHEPDGHRMVLERLLQPLREGHDLGLVSEAGLPAVADPGAELVALAHRLGYSVQPLTGPSSLMMALSASGLQGQCFAFVGYLPQDEAARAERIRELESRSRREQQTQLMIETPYRNTALMAALLRHLQPDTLLSVACGLTLEGGWCLTRSVAQWRQQPPTFDRSLPAVFSFLR